MRDGHNGYTASPGIVEAREAVAADFSRRGVPTSPDRVLITSGTSEGIELALTAIVNEGESVLVPSPTYPLYTAVLAKIGAEPSYYRTDPANGWLPDLDHIRRQITPQTRALVVIDPNNPTGAVYPDSCAARADRPRRRARTRDSRRRGVRRSRLRRRGRADGDARSRRADHFVFESCRRRISRQAGVPDGWRRRDAASRRRAWRRSRSSPTGGCAVPDRCSTPSSRRSPATGRIRSAFRQALRERAELTTTRMNAIPGMRCVAPRGAFYAMPQLRLAGRPHRQDFVLGLLRAKGVLVVYGSGFGADPADGPSASCFSRRSPSSATIYDDIADFAQEYR